MVKLQGDLKKVEAAGIRVIGISYDSVEVLKKFADRKKITFPLLSDAGSKTIKAYGLLNKEAVGKKIVGIPYPGTMLIDQSGVIRGKLFLKGYVERHSAADLIKAAEALK